jgi:hypothetical protein
MSRTDTILATIREELERRRSVLDGSDGLQSVSVIVKLRDGTRPHIVIFRTDTYREVRGPVR